MTKNMYRRQPRRLTAAGTKLKNAAMWSMSKTASRVLSLSVFVGTLLYSAILFGQEDVCHVKDDFTPPVQVKNQVVSRICIKGEGYKLVYQINKRTLFIETPKTKITVLERIPIGFEPEKVGAEIDFYFLPSSLQPYIDKEEVLYLSARRSSGGDGGGQCGSGIEKRLNVLGIKEKKPKLLSSFLITSCWKNIELSGSELEHKNPLSAFSVQNRNLRINFINYDEQGGVTAELSNDRRSLILNPIKTDGIGR